MRFRPLFCTVRIAPELLCRSCFRGAGLNTKKPNAENPNLKFVLDTSDNKYVELRRSGSSTGGYNFDAIFVDDDAMTYNRIVANDGTFVPGRIIGVQEIIVNTDFFVNDKEVWEFDVNFSPVAGAKRYLIVPKTINYGAYMNLDYSGNTISVKALNLSGESHSMTGRIYVIALNM